MYGIGPWEIVIILLIVALIFGAGRLTDVTGALGKSVREFRKAASADDESPAAAAPAPAEPAPGVVCPSCATANPAANTFCKECGTRLEKAA